jgi:hypothetical protein
MIEDDEDTILEPKVRIRAERIEKILKDAGVPDAEVCASGKDCVVFRWQIGKLNIYFTFNAKSGNIMASVPERIIFRGSQNAGV